MTSMSSSFKDHVETIQRMAKDGPVMILKYDESISHLTLAFELGCDSTLAKRVIEQGMAQQEECKKRRLLEEEISTLKQQIKALEKIIENQR